MVGLKLVRLIEGHSEMLARGMTEQIRKSNVLPTSARSHPRTCNWRRPRFIAI
jgi:hypothetical protein